MRQAGAEATSATAAGPMVNNASALSVADCTHTDVWDFDQ